MCEEMIEVNKIYNDDCLNILKQLPDKSIDLVLTDPPYLFNRGGGRTIGTEGKSKTATSELYKCDGKMIKEMGDFDKPQIYELLNECKRVCKIMRGYFFCNETALQYYLSWATENNFKYNIITLEKPISILNRNRYSTNSEFLVRIIAKSGAGLNILDYSDDSNNIEWLNSVQKFNKLKNKIHFAQKPMDIINGVIKLNTLENDIVLDCFSGSGTTAVACHNLKRRFICIERDIDYYNASVERLKIAQSQLKLF